jgi:hypothetical protein
MTIKELKEFIEDCNDDDYVTICSCCDDNPVTDYCDVTIAYKITTSNSRDNQICLMPM